MPQTGREYAVHLDIMYNLIADKLDIWKAKYMNELVQVGFQRNLWKYMWTRFLKFQVGKMS